jgi:hypothetical protein
MNDIERAGTSSSENNRMLSTEAIAAPSHLLQMFTTSSGLAFNNVRFNIGGGDMNIDAMSPEYCE